MPWKKTITRGDHPVLLVDAIVSGMSEYALRKLLNLEFGFKRYKRVSGASFLDEEEFNVLVSKFKEKIALDKHYLSELSNNYVKTAKHLVAKAKTFHGLTTKGKSSDQVNQAFIEFMEEYNQSTFFFYVPLFLEVILESEINEELSKHLKKRRKDLSVDHVLKQLTFPMKESLRKKHELDILAIAKQISENDVLKKEFTKRNELIIASLKRYRKLQSLIKQHKEEYAWINTYLFQVKEYSFDEIVKEIKDALKENPSQRLAEHKMNMSKQLQEYNLLVKALKISPSLLEKIKLVQEWNYLRSYRVDLYAMIHYYVYPLFQAVAVNLGLTYDELLQLTYKEIVGIMKFGLLNRQVLESRKEGHGWLMDEGKIKICTGFKLDEIKELEPEPEKLKDNKLYGTPAYSGMAEGVVHLVVDPYVKDDVKHFKKGDILVAKMTSADYTPLIRKAGAVVTDEGGLLCHALVLAREFQVPCLVGTNVATHFLKDGFKVKVNADEGFVKIVKKS
ncbi:hypothetical protein HYY69_03925 [Candidatus Woesearchaeota archaeon]|nr:hypothetical protein [Candidatus Woesearchaeota archaeon]